MPVGNAEFEATWLEAEDGGSLCALLNYTAGLGWLMYLRAYGDAGFSSRNPQYDGPADAMVEYRLDNGKHDLYPKQWAYPIEIIRLALKHFKATGQPPTFVEWHNDSGDGQDIIPTAPRHGERSEKRR
jgi:hypothetical protein